MIAAKKSAPVLVLRTCTKDMKGTSSHSAHFTWPRSGEVEAPDWNPDTNVECGQGLHGLLWGNGDWGLLSSDDDAVWMIVSVDPDEGMVVGTNKVRFRKGTVMYAGQRGEAITRILCGQESMAKAAQEAEEWQAKNKEATKAASSGNYSTAASSGNYSTAASSGDGSTAASSGNYSTAASSGNYSTAASSGNYSTAASSGDGSKAASSGNYSTAASSGYGSTAASSGNCSTAASSGYGSTAASSGYGSKAASSGNCSKAASSGYGSTAASSGDYSTAASSGYGCVAASIGGNGQAKAGENGLIILTWWDKDAKRHRACVGEVGINGIKADTFYQVRDGVLVEVA